jgi:predicted Zn-dependent peptidase
MTVTKQYNELLNETIYTKVHPSGLKIYFIPKKDYSMKYAFFATEYGSIYNEFTNVETGIKSSMPLGIAHFLEHKIFEESEGNIFEQFAKLGANVNAYTNFMSTAYMFSTVDHFYDALSLLMNFVQTPHLTDENVEKEKGIIAQEIKMYDDNPDWRVYFNTLSALYNDHPMKYDIAGTVESVYATTREDLEKCYDAFYTPDNMIVFVIGDLDEDEVFNCVENNLTEDFLSRKKIHNIDLPEEKDPVANREIIEKMEVPLPLFNVGFKDMDIPSDWKLRLKKALAIKISLDMGFGRGTAFYEDLYDEGLINFSFSGDNSYGRTFCHTLLGGESKAPKEVIDRVVGEIKRIKVDGFKEEVFDRIKKKTIGRYLSSFNSIQYIANSFVAHYMKGIDLFEYLEVLKEIDIAYVEEVFRNHFDEDNYTVSIIE